MFIQIIVNQKIQYNYSSNYYIPELLLVYSVVVDGEFLLEWCEHFGQLQLWYISYVALLEPLIWDVKVLHAYMHTYIHICYTQVIYRMCKNFRGWFNFSIFIVSVNSQKLFTKLSTYHPRTFFPWIFCLHWNLLANWPVVVASQTLFPAEVLILNYSHWLNNLKHPYQIDPSQYID